jgi:hypothetical protein
VSFCNEIPALAITISRRSLGKERAEVTAVAVEERSHSRACRWSEESSAYSVVRRIMVSLRAASPRPAR